MLKQTIRERITQYFKYKHISEYSSEKSLNKSKGFWNKSLNPSSDVLEKIGELYPDISAEWLLRGVGEMLLDKKQPNLPNEIIIKREIFEQIAKLTETVLSQQRTIELMQKEKHHAHAEKLADDAGVE